MELITGYLGHAHVTSEQAGATNAAAIGTGQYVFEIGECFAHTIVNNNEITIKDGYGINQGRFFCIEHGASESVTITSGTADKKRRDLIVVRYSKNTSTNVEQAQLVVVEGTPGDDYTTPEIQTGNILDNDSVSDFALYQVDIDGIAIDSVTALFEIGGGAASKVGFVGTRAEVDAAIEEGKIKEGMQVIITDDITPVVIEASTVAYTTPSGSASNVKSELDTLNYNLANIEPTTVSGITWTSNLTNNFSRVYKVGKLLVISFMTSYTSIPTYNSVLLTLPSTVKLAGNQWAMCYGSGSTKNYCFQILASNTSNEIYFQGNGGYGDDCNSVFGTAVFELQ